MASKVVGGFIYARMAANSSSSATPGGKPGRSRRTVPATDSVPAPVPAPAKARPNRKPADEARAEISEGSPASGPESSAPATAPKAGVTSTPSKAALAAKRRALAGALSSGSSGRELVLGLDIGTSSLRCALFDSRGNRIPGTTAQAGYSLKVKGDGTAELSAAGLLRATILCLQTTLAAHAQGEGGLSTRAIVAVGMSCFWHSQIGVTASGRAVTPIYTWADSRCREDAARLRREWSEEEAHTRTGCMVRCSYWPARTMWLRRTQPELCAKVARWVSPGEWLLEQLTGVPGGANGQSLCSISMASGTGLYNVSNLEWDGMVLGRLNLTAAHMNSVGDAPLRMHPEQAARYPALAEAAWYSPIGDGAASNLGSGATSPGMAAINVGTSAAVRIIHKLSEGEAATAPFGLFCYRVDDTRALVGGAISNAGNLRQWCLRELMLPDDDAVIERALKEMPGPDHGLTVLPFWVNERAPTWPEDLSGTIFGLQQSTSAIDILQATTEAVYHRLAEILRKMRDAGQTARQLIVSGGIQKSRTGLQRLCNVLGQPVWASPEPEASLRGAAVYALGRMGREADPLELGKPLEPDPEIATAYIAARTRQIRLEEAMHGFAKPPPTHPVGGALHLPPLSD
ncbi:MAG: gluconokinase [Candidatus Methylacidiphilales bacterium]|nr:gluconokinase [Candidatus Methylacidiphilales bacterium]